MSSADFSSAISVIALAVSLFTLWFTVLRHGSIRCKRPSFVAIKYDFVDKPQAQAKVVFRAVLFSTGKRGPMIEQLFIRVSEGKRQTEFSFWGHGHDDKLTRGSGLYVPETGVAAYHHFNPTDADTLFRFSGGTYSVELMASLVGRKQLVSLGGLPKVIRSDNGKEFCGKAMVTWAHERGVQLRLIEPGKPNQNAYIESFNGRFRDECLNEH
jgi:hypothetical protein